MAGGAPGHVEATPGDHLQTLYHLWLPGHQAEHGRAPWRDPYSFQPESRPTIDFAAWPFGVAFWPLDAALGHVRAWNAFVLLIYLAAGGLACLWLRELGLPRGAALAGGLAFAIAPYRVAQSTGHLLGPISILLPLALYALERRRLVLAVVAVASIPLSGQVHFALGAVPFVCAYALVRSRDRRTLVGVAAAVAAAIAAGLLVKITTIDHSHLASGRSLHAVSQYSAHWADLVRRTKSASPERFVFLGWATPVLAAIGLALLGRARRGLALVLGLGALVPIVLALGTHTPLYSPLWHALPPFRYPRVPERLLPIACLCSTSLLAQNDFGGSEPHEQTVRLNAAPSWGIRIIVAIAGLAAWYGTQYLIRERPPMPAEDAAKAAALLAEHDVILRLTEPINRFLNLNPRWANRLLMISSAVMDGLVGFVIIWSIVGPSFRPFIGLIILFGLRQICQALTALPPPPGMIWRYPGFPSLFVTYGVSNDQFFSGHTAMAIYGVVELALLGSAWLLAVSVAIAVFETITVLLLRAHYTMDVFAGLVTALLVAAIAWHIGPACDAALAQLF